jgi:ribosomal protein L31E
MNIQDNIHIHFLAICHMMPEAKQAVEALATFVQRHLNRQAGTL